MHLGPVGFIPGRQVNDGFAKLVGIAGALGVHALDGAAFVVPPLEGLLAGIVLTLRALVCHGRNMRPIPKGRHPWSTPEIIKLTHYPAPRQ